LIIANLLLWGPIHVLFSSDGLATATLESVQERSRELSVNALNLLTRADSDHIEARTHTLHLPPRKSAVEGEMLLPLVSVP
jgi:hypothetical protein